MSITAENVISGIGKPKFCVITDDEYCENSTFEEGSTTGWGVLGGGSLVADDEEPNFYGDYSGKIGGSSSSDGARYITPYDSFDFELTQYVITIHYWCDSLSPCSSRARLMIYASSSAPAILIADKYLYPKKVFGYKRYMKRVSLITDAVPSQSLGNNKMQVRFYPNVFTGDVYVRITKLMIREIKDIIQFSEYPTKQKEVFEPESFYEQTTIRGDKRISNKGYRYFCDLKWDYFSKYDQKDYELLTHPDATFFFPHDDVDYGILSALEVDEDIVRKWMKDKAIGHEVSLSVEGLELLECPQGDID